ncbi:hypothetical protein A9179_06775 [Pseudomonas alcaligenes]|uniref:Uncharacterized protein n=1 Tax=Aquipseudomonas alcaligenes TaxID=43263 RepID=A0ABR7S0G6_AQUAC|nr:hypothetical protein [Pseudomonas alcaligenes]MBC9249978.1 hypothetical protein [Pseudomonas alcaligenes]
MTLRLAALALTLSLTPLAYAADSNEAQARYRGAISCIDRLFWDGGYDEGDSQREKMINEFLGHYQLPAYNEVIYSQGKAIEGDADMQAYMAGYDLCSQDTDYVIALGKRYGHELPEE